MKLAIFLLMISLFWTFTFGRECFECTSNPQNYNAACAKGTSAALKESCPRNEEGGGTQPDPTKFVCATMITPSSTSSKGKIVRGCQDKNSADYKKFGEKNWKQSHEGIHYYFCSDDTCNNKNPSNIKITPATLNCYRCNRGNCKEFDEEEDATPCPSEDEILLVYNDTPKSNYYCTTEMTDEKVIRGCTHKSDIDTKKYGDKLDGCNEQKKEGGNMTKYCVCNKDKCNGPKLGGEVSSAVKALGLSLAILISVAVLSFLA